VGVQNKSQDEPASRDTTFQDANDDGDGSISSLDEENLSAPVTPVQQPAEQPVSGCDHRRSSQQLRTERATEASRMQLEETGVILLRGDDSIVEKVVECLGMPVATKKPDDGTVKVRRAENPGTSQTPKYSLRKNRKTDGYNLNAEYLLAIDDEPTTYSEAVESDEAKEWKTAMNEEYNSLMKNQTWVLTSLPQGRQPIKCKWVYKIKRNSDGTIERYKARLVAKAYSQRSGIDYEETYSPVVRMESIRVLLSIVAEEDLEMVHFDSVSQWLAGGRNLYAAARRVRARHGQSVQTDSKFVWFEASVPCMEPVLHRIPEKVQP